MAYSGNPATSAIDRVRLACGDIFDDIELLDDETYQWLITTESNERLAALKAAQFILFSLARYARERAGDIEYYGQEFFNNYRNALKDFMTGSNVINAVPYAGGISKTDMYQNRLDCDVNGIKIYEGFSKGIPSYFPSLYRDYWDNYGYFTEDRLLRFE